MIFSDYNKYNPGSKSNPPLLVSIVLAFVTGIGTLVITAILVAHEHGEKVLAGLHTKAFYHTESGMKLLESSDLVYWYSVLIHGGVGVLILFLTFVFYIVYKFIDGVWG